MGGYAGDITTNTLSTAVSWGTAGAAVGGPIGAVIGGVAGAVAGAFSGASFGRKKAKAKRYQRLALEAQKDRQENSAYMEYLQQIRQARMARAKSLQAAVNSGVGSSSLASGALSSISSQLALNTQYTAEDFRLVSEYNKYMRLAQKNVNAVSKAQTGLNMFNTVVGMVGAASLAGSAGAGAGAGAGVEAGVEAGAAGTTSAAGTTAAAGTSAATGTGSTGFLQGLGNYLKENPLQAYQMGSGLASSIGQTIDFFFRDSDEDLDLIYPYVYDL